MNEGRGQKKPEGKTKNCVHSKRQHGEETKWLPSRRHTASFQCTMWPDVVSTLEQRRVSTGSNKKGKT